MKKTQFIELLCLVRHTLVPFLSIVLFVTMGITLYAGLTWTGTAMQDRIDTAYDQANTSDFVVASKLGLTDADLADISDLQGVACVEPAYLAYETVHQGTGEGNSNLYCSVSSITEQINTLDLVEGTLPTGPDEIALLSNCTKYCDYKVGDTVTFDADGDDPAVNGGMKYLKGRTFTITALVSSSQYLGVSLGSLGINSDGRQITCVFYAAKDAFSSDAFDNSYPIAYVTGDGFGDLSSFGEAYSAASGELFATIKQAGVTLAQRRYEEVKGETDKKLSDAQGTLSDAKSKIDDAQAQISDGEQQLADKKVELADAQTELDDGKVALDSKKQEAEAQIAQAESQIATYEQHLAQMQEQYDAGTIEVEYYDRMSASLKSLSTSISGRFMSFKDEAQARAFAPGFTDWLANRCTEENAITAQEVASFKQEYPDRPSELDQLLDGLQLSPTDKEADLQAAMNAAGLGMAAEKIQTDAVEPGREALEAAQNIIEQLNSGIASAREQLDAKRQEYNQATAQAEQQIADGEAQIESGEAQLADGEAQLDDAKSQLADKKSQYEAGEKKYEDGEAKAKEIKPSGWIVSDRDDTYVEQLANTTTQTLGSLRLTMALLFIVVGLLVCYSVMSRLVHEHRTQLGTKKALGFSTFEISKLFLGYALLASALGILLGTFLGAPVVELVLIPRINRYVFDAPGVMFRFSDIVAVALVQVVLICLSAWLACRSILKRNAVELLAGQRPSSAKRRFYEGWACWKRMGLLAQTMVNNCFNDKRRVFGTLVGVAGCTSLIVCAMTLQSGISNTIEVQESVVERFDQVVYVAKDRNGSSASSSDGAAATVDEIIASAGYPSLRAQYDIRSVLLPDGSEAYATLIVPEDVNDLSNVMSLQMVSGDSSMGESGVYISNALADYYHYAVGDEIAFESLDGTKCTAAVAGIFNYYGGTHVAIMSKDAYASAFGHDARCTARLVASGDDASAFSQRVSAAVDCDKIIDSREATRAISSTINTLAMTVVAIYIGISALVALFVLLNLNIMYVSEKKCELVVMMVNGYEVKDAKRYVSRDSVIMNVLGMIVGCLLGTWAGIMAVQSLQNNRLEFIGSVSPLAWLVGVVVCAIFAFIVMRIALRRVDKFNLTSVND